MVLREAIKIGGKDTSWSEEEAEYSFITAFLVMYNEKMPTLNTCPSCHKQNKHHAVTRSGLRLAVASRDKK